MDDLARWALNATAARRVGDDRTADYWTERVEVESLRREREAKAAEWDVLKGSPDTSRLGNG